MINRSGALIALLKGRTAEAKKDLKEGCPKAGTGELEEAWSELLQLPEEVDNPSESRQILSRELCPL